ncbi:MAG: hypothetical protein ACUVR0_07585 [Candidatus Aminicenantales bacterium]
MEIGLEPRLFPCHPHDLWLGHQNSFLATLGLKAQREAQLGGTLAQRQTYLPNRGMTG